MKIIYLLRHYDGKEISVEVFEDRDLAIFCAKKIIQKIIYTEPKAKHNMSMDWDNPIEDGNLIFQHTYFPNGYYLDPKCFIEVQESEIKHRPKYKESSGHGCCCMGRQDDEPLCPCAMTNVFKRNGHWWNILLQDEIFTEYDLGKYDEYIDSDGNKIYPELISKDKLSLDERLKLFKEKKK